MPRLFHENAGLIFSIITSIVFCSAAFGVAQNQINHNKEAINEWKEDHDILVNVQNDVRWIRAAIQRMDEEQ